MILYAYSVQSWSFGAMEKVHGVHKVFLQLKKLSLFSATAESVDCSLFLKNLEKHFCNLTWKNFVQHIENLPQHLLQKFIGYRYRFKKLRFIGIAQRFFEVIALLPKGLSCPSLDSAIIINSVSIWAR